MDLMAMHNHSKKSRKRRQVMNKISIPPPPPVVIDRTAECVANDEANCSPDGSSCTSSFDSYFPSRRHCSRCPSRCSSSAPSEPSPPPWGGEKRFSCYLTYLSIFLCVFAMACFYLKMRVQLESHSGSCNICDEQVAPPLQRGRKGDGLNYASEKHNAQVVKHGTFPYMQGGLWRVPSMESALPDVLLQDNDACYSMQGNSGTFIIQLSRPIIVHTVTLAHNRVMCDAAPKDFVLYALKDKTDNLEISLGRFRYDNRGSLEQKFVVPKYDEVGYVGIKIMSNWGNKDHTSICQVQVNGEIKF